MNTKSLTMRGLLSQHSGADHQPPTPTVGAIGRQCTSPHHDHQLDCGVLAKGGGDLGIRRAGMEETRERWDSPLSAHARRNGQSSQVVSRELDR